MSDDVHCYPPDYLVLKNKLGLIDPAALDRYERRSVVQRIDEGIPAGNFDLAHLRAIHRHLFQDVYDWAGKLRTVEIAKGGNQFQFRQYIATGMADVHRRIVAAGNLKGLSARAFADKAGHEIDLTRIVPEDWLEASKAAHGGHYGRFGDCIHAALVAAPEEA